jgi:molybdopterin-containing oxidoreductase family iron-sulfur binding subunit
MTVGLADGSLSNVSWLQEFPDPVTKICWDNYVCISPKDAKKEGLSEGDTVQLSAADRSVSVPVHIQPGQADGVLGLAVGYGRSRMGKIADGVGVNAYTFSVYKEGQTIYAGLPAKIEKLATKASLACTQGHHSMEGREIVIEATLAQYQKNPSANVHREKIKSIWSEYTYPNHKWGMVIDLNSCTGCSACLVACQSENNVPVVGKRYVLRGREMHWIRVDRYYTGEPSDPQAVFQPLTCQHCDNAPCETVCPVLATVHSDEGTNDMIYNRCVGTRYCSNNCPYKVRRFNWFNYVKTIEKPLHNQLNPEVTVRARGVMEKCTFCTHRIKEAKNKARNEDRELRDGDVRTACQETCPADAITFGDLKDKNSAVSRLFDSERNYSLLGELNTKPAVHYLTKIRNTQALKGHES